MIETHEDGSIEGHPVVLDSIWRATDPKVARCRHQVSWISEDGFDIGLTMIDNAGYPVPGQTWRHPISHLQFGEAWAPDTSGLPVAYMSVDGQLRPLPDMDGGGRAA